MPTILKRLAKLLKIGKLLTTDMPKQNSPKIKALILHILAQQDKYPNIGQIHMNKILFAADFEAFRERGESITGAKYRKDKYGAILYPMKPIQTEMAEENLIQLKPLRLDKCSSTCTYKLDDYDLRIVNRWIAELGPLLAKKVRDKFHELPYWSLLKKGEQVPYSSAYWRITQEDDITESDIEDAKTILTKYKDKPLTRPNINPT